MTLVVADGLLGIVTELSKSDPDGVEMLVELGMIEALFDQLAAHDYFRVPITKAVDARTREARRAVVRTFVGKRLEDNNVTDVMKAGAAIAATSLAVHKANEWEEREHPRDPQTGRFTEIIGGKGVSFQGHRQHLAAKMTDWRDTGFVNSGTKVAVHGSDVSQDDKGKLVQGGPRTLVHQIPDRTQHPLEGLPNNFLPQMLEVHPADTNQRPAGGQQVFDVAQHLTAPSTAHRIAGATSGISNPSGFKGALSNFVRPSSDGDRRAWRQTQATGQAISALSKPGSTQHALGSFAQLVGSLGPQAEEVLGPGIKRTAYRYRGTEKRPDAGLVRDVAFATEPTAEMAGREDLNSRRGFDTETDQMDLKLRGDAATDYFLERLPDDQQTAISMAAGRVPPSQGAIIDAHGDVSTEAMGFADDHYLPFDLKNLKRLKGGQYVRTRAAGGPTTEDIYAGLMTGTRQLQVVSNSGVFTVDFDPDLRGGRRVSDKARSMVGRYTKILDAIQQGDLYATDLDSGVVRQLHEQALDEVGPDNPAGVKDRFTELKNQKRLELSIQGSSDEDIQQAAEGQAVTEFNQTGGKPSMQEFRRRVRDIAQEKLDAERADRVKVLQLDGEGYFAAMRALQQEYPYFIRHVDYESLRDYTESRKIQTRRPLPKPPGPDRGYVGPGEDLPNLRGRAPRNISGGSSTGTQAPPTEERATGRTPEPPSASPASVGGPASSRRPGGAAAGEGGLTAAASAQMGDLQRGIGRTLRETAASIDVAAADEQDPGDHEKDEDLVAGTPMFVRTMMRRHRDIGQWLASAPLDQVNAFKEGLSEAYDSVGDFNNMPAKAEERLGAALDATDAILQARDPFEQVDPLEHAPEDASNARPAFDEEIDKLGTDEEKYNRYLERHPEVKTALGQLGSDPAAKISDLTYRWQVSNQWVDGGLNAPKPSNKIPGDFAQTRAWVNNPATKKDLLALHKAWAFKVARELARNLRGEEAPKAPEPPAAASGMPGPPRHLQAAGADEEEFGLRDDPAQRWNDGTAVVIKLLEGLRERPRRTKTSKSSRRR